MDKSNHIKELTIGNYRRFQDFNVKDIGQFNLIVGDNNTGKTSLLEALTVATKKFSKNEYTLKILAQILLYRNKKHRESHLNDILYNNINLLRKEKNPLNFSFTFNDNNPVELTIDLFDYDTHLQKLSIESKTIFEYDNGIGHYSFAFFTKQGINLAKITNDMVLDFFPFIPFGTGYTWQIENLFSTYQRNVTDLKNLIENIKILLNNIVDIRLDNELGIMIYEKNENLSRPIYSYGEGSVKTLRIILELFYCRDRFLNIDEIDAGIHHSRFLNFWKTVLQVAKNYNVQLFATTHNEECIYYYRKALEELEQESTENKTLFSDEARLISLREINNDVKASSYHLSDMQYAAEVGRELRGGVF